MPRASLYCLHYVWMSGTSLRDSQVRSLRKSTFDTSKLDCTVPMARRVAGVGTVLYQFSVPEIQTLLFYLAALFELSVRL